MTNFEDLTPEQQRLVREWQEGLTGKRVHVSRVKREDYPHWHLRTWLSEVAFGRPAQVRREGGTGPSTDATLLGLRVVADHLPHVLLVEVSGLPGVWGMRAPRTAWVRDIEVPAETVRIEVVDEPVIAWQVSAAGVPGRKEEMPAPSESEEWTLRTTSLEESS